MANTNPARGMRDFLPADIRKRNYVINIIKEVYESYGFEPLETPSVENLETLTGKYGEEGNQLMFKILKRGEKLQNELEAGNIKSENELTDLALRYDLTIPLARVVANYKNDLPKFFKRYQIQPVWRADRPARGRYREFYQCDVDAIGSKSMVVEAELISAACDILERLGFEDFIFRLNHRNVLSALLSSMKVSKDRQPEVLTILDKLDKIGIKQVIEQLRNCEIEDLSIVLLHNALEAFSNKRLRLISLLGKVDSTIPDSINRYVFEVKSNPLLSDDLAQQAIYVLSSIIDLISNPIVRERIVLEPFLARGISYYTGAIFEVVLTKGDFTGSIAGGGRYDGLIEVFGKEEIPAVGISLGLERILMIMEERGMFPAELQTNSADVMVTIWNEETVSESLKLAGELRAQGLRVLVYPEADKLGKQFKYADSINIPFVCVLGDEELKQNKVALKNLKSGEQEIISRDQIASKISN